MANLLDETSSLRKSQSLPHIAPRTDFNGGFNGAGVGSCSVLDQIVCTQPNTKPFHGDKATCGTKFVPDFRQLMTLRQHYYPEGGWGWLLVFICSIVQCLSHGLHMALGVFIVFVIKNFQQHLLISCFLGAFSMGTSLLVSPAIISLCKRKSTRLIAVIGGLVLALGCLFASFATQFHQIVLSYGIIVGIGVGVTRDCSTLIVAQYFKRKRELVEIFIVAGSGIGMIFMSIFYQTAFKSLGWRLGLQTITVAVFSTFFLGIFYRSASLYHPQRRAILHLKNQKRKIKDRKKPENTRPFFDFNTLKSKTLRILILSVAISSFGIHTPIFFLVHQITGTSSIDNAYHRVIEMQTYLGIAFIVGCLTFGFLVVRNSAECQIARQYLYQTTIIMCGLSILAMVAINRKQEEHILFTWIYGIFYGGYFYTLKVYVYERVRARNFARAWSFIQAAQTVPILLGVLTVSYLAENVTLEAGYYFSFICTLIGFLVVFWVDIYKRKVARNKSSRMARHYCLTDECPQAGKFAFIPETEGENHYHVDAIHVSNSANQQDDDDGNEQPNDMDKPELTCISEEGIADMDLPDNLFDDLDFVGDCITSCNKVENYLMLSEFENNLNAEMPIILQATECGNNHMVLHNERLLKRSNDLHQFAGNSFK